MMSETDRIREAIARIPADCDRDTWVKLGMAVKSELGDAGFDVWDGWSQRAESYDPRDAKDVWRSIKSGKVSIGTLYYEAKAHGWVNGSHEAPNHEEVAQRKREAAERAKAEATKLVIRQALAARLATKTYQRLPAAPTDNPYLVRKQVAPPASEGFYGLRETTVSDLTEFLSYTPKSSGEPLQGRVLVVPVIKADGLLSTLEFIDERGRKTALYGGAKAGCYWLPQPLPDSDGPGTLVIAEGVATTLTCVQCGGGFLGVAALSSGNLVAAAKAMRARYPTRDLVVAADLVRGTRDPDPHAVDAARSVRARLAIPTFPDPGVRHG